MYWEATKQLLAALIRTGLFTLATFLVTKGWVEPELADAFVNEATSIVVGVLIVVVVAVWQVLKTRYNILAIFEAMRQPAPITDSQAQTQLLEVKQEVKANHTVTSV